MDFTNLFFLTAIKGDVLALHYTITLKIVTPPISAPTVMECGSYFPYGEKPLKKLHKNEQGSTDITIRKLDLHCNSYASTNTTFLYHQWPCSVIFRKWPLTLHSAKHCSSIIVLILGRTPHFYWRTTSSLVHLQKQIYTSLAAHKDKI